jgi:hypothetical protein
MLTRKRVKFGFDLPTRFVTLATMLSLVPTAVPVVGYRHPAFLPPSPSGTDGAVSGDRNEPDCDGWRHEHLVAFSCKRRGFCLSCGARRMIETSAHLIDHVLPAVPIRQWVLGFPWPLRLLLSTRPEAGTGMLAIVTRAIETALIRRAVLTRKSGACGGIVTLIQRFGSSLNLNVHIHMLVLDGVYANEHGKLRFQPLLAPAPAMMTQLLDAIVLRVLTESDPRFPTGSIEARAAEESGCPTVGSGA